MVKPDLIDKVLEEIGKRPANYEYFFSKLNSPEWIDPLFDKGMFRNPPKPVQDGHYVSFPFWPESRYLARMAKIAPLKVLNVTLKIPETDNFRVNEDIIDIALSLPSDLVEKIVSRAKKSIKSPYASQIATKLGQLVAHLAKEKQVDTALELARDLLAVLPDSRVAENGDEEKIISPKPRARFDIWDYKEILEKHIPTIVEVASEGTFDMLCDILEQAIVYSGNEKPYDYSYIWRPAIEDHEQNRGYNVLKDALVTSIRDTSRYIAEKDPSKLQFIIDSLEERGWCVFYRIAIHLLRLFAETVPNLVEKHLTDRKLFDDPAIRHEYALLLRDRFSKLAASEQKTILIWIERGHEVDELKERMFRWSGKPPSEEDIVKNIKYWKRDKLAVFSSSLPPDWKSKYEELVSELGPAEDTCFPYKMSTTWVGPTSPKTVDEIQSMDISEIIHFLKTWTPSRDPMSPSAEGLGRMLTEAVASDPEKYSEHANDFLGLNPVYIRAIVHGWHDAIGKKLVFSWPPVLELCYWAVSQLREVPDEKVISEYDLDWSGAWKGIARLISSGFEKSPAEMPIELREKVWQVIIPITGDSDPTPDYESRYGGSNMDPVTMSINTTRCEALHTVVRYALWVKRKLNNESDLDKSFIVMPEVQKILEHHLDLAQDPALSVRVVYGQWFPWLLELDREWTIKNLSKIFPNDEKFLKFRDTAWNAYIVLCEPYDDVLEVLREEYRSTIERIDSASEKDSFGSPNESLVEHLMVFYYRGKLSFEDQNGLLAKFYDVSPDGLRGRAIDFIGRSFYNTKEIIPPQIIDRVKDLWEYRVNTAMHAQSSDAFKEELSHFGWWFISQKFDNSWVIEQIKEVLKLVKKIDPSSMVVERLAEVAKLMPLQTVECLDLIVESEKKGGGIYSFRNNARTIIETAINSSNPTARQVAENVIHKLGAYTFWDFRDLLFKKRS